MAIKRDTIVSAMQTRLAACTVAGGYHTTLTNRVATWQPAPAGSWGVVLLPKEEPITETLINGIWGRTLAIDISVQADGSTSGTTVSQIVEDIYKAIGTDIQWSGNAINTRPVRTIWEVDQNEKRITGATITVEIDYRTGAWAES